MPQNAQASHTVCADGQVTQGVDVSHWNGQIDWAAVAADSSQIKFAIAEAGEGSSTVDTKFSTNWQGIAAAGLIRGAAWFVQPGGDAASDMNLFLATAGAFGPGDLPPILWVETTAGQSPANIASYLNEALTRIQTRTGRTPIIYTSASFWENSLQNTTLTYHADIWIASWNITCPSIPSSWGNWVIWQYSSAGSVNGITGAVDLNVFNGSAQDLVAYANDSCSSQYVKNNNTGQQFDLMQDAYNGAATGQTILTRAVPLGEDLNFANGKIITLIGGYGCDFQANLGFTTINSLTIGGTDTLTISNVMIK